MCEITFSCCQCVTSVDASNSFITVMTLKFGLIVVVTKGVCV